MLAARYLLLTRWSDGIILSRVTKYYAESNGELDAVFGALSDVTRRTLIERLALSPASVTQLAEPFAASLPTIVEHLRVLERAGLVSSQKVGRVRTYQLAPDAFVPANAWMVTQQRPQERRLDRLGEFLTRDEGEQS